MKKEHGCTEEEKEEKEGRKGEDKQIGKEGEEKGRGCNTRFYLMIS